MFQEHINRDGYALADTLLSDIEISSLLRSIDSASSRRTKAGIRHVLDIPAVGELARHFQMMEIAGKVLGRDAVPFHATFFDKSPDANWLVVWHQDTALPLRDKCESKGWGPWSVKQGVIYAHAPASALQKVLALRIHLDDSNPDNGPLRVLPGTHELGILSDDSIEQISTQIPAAECIVPRGGILAMRPLIVHSSSKSMAKTPRRVLHIEYAASITIAEGMELARA